MSKDGVSIVVIVNRGSNGQLILTSVTSNTNIINTTTVTNYKILNNYTTDVDFSRVDVYVRKMIQILKGAKVVEVWIQFLENGVMNYRIVYLTTTNITIEVTCRRDSSNTFTIISNKILSKPNTTNTNINVNITTNVTTNVTTNTSTNTNFGLNIFNTAYVGLASWSTNSEFLIVDQYVRSQFSQIRNSQVVAVWIMVQVNVGATYKIQYLVDGRTLQVIVNKIKDSDRITVISTSFIGGYQVFNNYQNDL